MNTTISVEIISDFACPWCFIAEHRLAQAISMRPGMDITVSWLPYLLYPDLPPGGVKRWDAYHKMYGVEKINAIFDALAEAGKEYNIIFGRDPNTISSSTIPAHTLMYWASMEEQIDVNDVAEKIFTSYQVHNENIGDIEVLTKIAASVGMNVSAIKKRLLAGEDQDIVKENVRATPSGVPYFILNGKYALAGAQKEEAFLSVFDQVAAQKL